VSVLLVIFFLTFHNVHTHTHTQTQTQTHRHRHTSNRTHTSANNQSHRDAITDTDADTHRHQHRHRRSHRHNQPHGGSTTQTELQTQTDHINGPTERPNEEQTDTYMRLWAETTVGRHQHAPPSCERHRRRTRTSPLCARCDDKQRVV